MSSDPAGLTSRLLALPLRRACGEVDRCLFGKLLTSGERDLDRLSSRRRRGGDLDRLMDLDRERESRLPLAGGRGDREDPRRPAGGDLDLLRGGGERDRERDIDLSRGSGLRRGGLLLLLRLRLELRGSLRI